MLQTWDQGQEQDDHGMTDNILGQPVHIWFTKAKIKKAPLGEPVPENRGIQALPKGKGKRGPCSKRPQSEQPAHSVG